MEPDREYVKKIIADGVTSEISFDAQEFILKAGKIAVPTVTYGEGYPVFRSRINDKKGLYIKKSELGAPPADLNIIKSYQRASFPGQSIFYGSIFCSTEKIGYETSIRETIQRNIESENNEPFLVTVSQWLLTREARFMVICSDLESDYETLELKQTSKFVREYITNLVDVGDDQKKYYKDILRYISNDFRKEVLNADAGYKFSAHFSDYILNQSEYSKEIDGIIYPSFATESRGLNIAMKKGRSASLLNLSKVCVYSVLNEPSKLTLRPTKYYTGSIPIEGDWLGPYEENHLYTIGLK